MKRFQQVLLATFILTATTQVESHEIYDKIWLKCEGFQKKYGVYWHLHENNGYPEQHLRYSNHLGPPWSYWPPSPWTGKYNFCTGPLPETYWFHLIECRTAGIDCKSLGIIPIPNESTYPQPCEAP